MVVSIILVLMLLAGLLNEFSKDKEIKVAIITGFMVGALYDDDEGYKTFQLLLGIFAITIEWE